MFVHLKKVNQTYFEHLLNAMFYSYLALKASFYFFIHSLIPDLFEYDGSILIYQLNKILNSNHQDLYTL